MCRGYWTRLVWVQKRDGTREAIFSLQTLSRKCKAQKKIIHICFIDYEMSIDRVNHVQLLYALHGLGLEYKELALLTNLYWNQFAKIKKENASSSNVKINRDVRQGCILSSTLFNV